MAILGVGVTANGTVRAAPELPEPNKALANRYTGLAAYFNSAPPSLTSDGSLLAAARKREEEARAAAARAQAALSAQQGAGRSILDVARGPFAGTPGPYAPGKSPSDIAKAQQDAVNTPMSRPVDTPGYRPGAEKPGYKQEKVFEGSKLVGWKYVVDSTSGAVSGYSAADAYSGNNWMERNVMPDPASVSDVATRHYTNDMLTEADRQGIEGSADPRDQAPYYRAIADEVYGKGVQKTNAWGETYYEYPTDKKYSGIPDSWAKEGWMPSNTPKPPGPDASFEEQNAYRQKVREAIVAPRYRVGDNVPYVRNLPPDQVFALQKQLKQAGLLDPDIPIFKGKFNAEQYQLIDELMAEANVTGVTLEQAIAGHVQTHQASIAAGRGGGGGGGGGPDTQSIQVTYNTTSLAQGRSMLARILTDAMGRPPSDSELSQYMARLNAAEAKSPTRTVTNYVRGGGSTTSTSRTTPTTVDPESMAREFATEINGGSEMFDMQANSYLDKLMQSLIGAQNGG